MVDAINCRGEYNVLCLSSRYAFPLGDWWRMDWIYKSLWSIPSRRLRQISPQCIFYVSVSNHFYSTLALLIMSFLILSLYFLSCRMMVQECQKKRIYHVGFIDPSNIHEESVRKWPNRTENNIFMALDRHHTCQYILFRTTSSEFFIFFLDFTIYMCIYIQYFLYIYVHETGFTGSFLLSRSINVEFGCTTPWGSQQYITKTS